MRAAIWQAVAGNTGGLAIQLSFIVVLGLGGARVVSGTIDVGTLVAFLLYLYYLMPPMRELAHVAAQYQVGAAAIARIREVEAMPAEPASPHATLREPDPRPASVAFEDVRFRYRPELPEVHHGVTFAVPPGGMTAFVGPSGAGKSGDRPPAPVDLTVHRGTGFTVAVVRTAEVAQLAEVNPQTLRYYERRGLLPDPGRSGSGYRRYGPDAVRIVRFIKSAQQVGCGLSQVEVLLELARGGPDTGEAARQLASDTIMDLDGRIACLLAMRDCLQRLVATCTRPPAQRECPLLERLGEDAAP